MKTLKDTLYEGILSGVDNTVNSMDKDVESVLNVPTVKDFERHQYNRNLYTVVWRSPILNKYKEKYPMCFGRADGLAIAVRKAERYIDIYPQAIVDSDNKRIPYHVSILTGWSITYVRPFDLRAGKKFAINFINTLAHDEKKLDEFFAHSNKCYIKALNNDYDFDTRDIDELL